MLKRVFSLAFLFLLVASVCFAGGDKIKAVYYYGETCGYCKKLEPWLNEQAEKHKSDLIIEKHEIFRNREENKLFNQMMELYNIPRGDRGTPTMIINQKVLIGYDKIQKEMESELKKALETAAAEREAAKAAEGKDKASHVKHETLTVAAIFLAAAADSINPCAMMVLLILLGSLVVYQKNDIVRIVSTVVSFISAVFITYFVLGLGIINLIVSSKMAEQISMLVGVLAISVGLLSLKDAFWYSGSGLEIPAAWKERITNILLKIASPLGAFAAGMVVTMFELPCTGGPYLFGLSLIADSTSIIERIGYLFLYNVVFVSPLVAIAILCIRGVVAIEQAEKFRNDHIKAIRCITGIVMLTGGIWLLLFR